MKLFWIEQSPYQDSVIIDGREIKLSFTNTYLDVLVVIFESGHFVFDKIQHEKNPKKRRDIKKQVEKQCKDFILT